MVSVFVVLRRLAFVSDALTHTVFPGVVIGFLVARHRRDRLGGAGFAVLSAVLLTVLAARARVTEDATMAVLLTGFFSVGVVLVSRRSSYTADLTAFLFGRILTVDRRQIVVTAVLGGRGAADLALLGKELVLRAFDPDGAAAAGYRVVLLDLVLNLVVALVVVAAVRAVGTVLVIALLVVPGAAARLVTDRLAVMFAVAAGIGALGRLARPGGVVRGLGGPRAAAGVRRDRRSLVLGRRSTRRRWPARPRGGPRRARVASRR